MKQSILTTLLAVFIIGSSFGISPFYKLGVKNESINAVALELTNTLTAAKYEILGTYNVGNDANKMVIVFTNPIIKTTALGYADRGGLAIAQKVGLIYADGKTTVSWLNPMYMFNAYFRKDMAEKEGILKGEYQMMKQMFSSIGYSFSPFGGEMEVSDLHKYKYMMGMPGFNSPVTLKEFNSFNEGVKTIQKNLAAKKGNTKKAFEIIDTEKQVAVFGVGLLDAEAGEKNFLGIIGDTHLAAMPYEIILQGKEASILHGRFRFALYWPELTMGTFTKIMSTPGDVESFMEALTE